MVTMKTLNGYGFDSAKLGSKAPEYYIQPRNLLDNSDFRIAQAGYGGKHGSMIYAADRWTQNGTTSRIYSYVTKNGHGALKCVAATIIQQKIELTSGVTYTAAVYINDTLNVRTFTANGGEYGSGALRVKHQSNGRYMFIVSDIPSGGTVSEPVLYQGSYTAETLPPYVPKGYAAELAECRLYYRTGTGRIARPFTSGNLTYLCEVSYEIPMRVKPNVSIKNIKNWSSQSNLGISATKNIGDQFGFNSIKLSSSASDNIIQFDYESTADL